MSNQLIGKVVRVFAVIIAQHSYTESFIRIFYESQDSKFQNLGSH